MLERFLVITINHSYAGFFAYVNFVINQIIYAKARGLRPVVHFGPVSGDGPNAFLDPGVGDNSWDLFFEPVDGITYAELAARLADSKDPLTVDQVERLDSEALWRLHCSTPESVFVYPHGIHYRRFRRNPDWYPEQRARACPIVDKYIRVKPRILAKVDQFAEKYFADRPVLGLHLRGTDKGTAMSPADLMRIVPPEEYFPYIEDFTSAHGPCRIFAATDQAQFLDRLRARYGERVVSYDAIRSSDRKNPFDVQDGHGYRKGEEVLIDCLLLSRCDHLLKCTSAVGEFAQYFNPYLTSIDLNLVTDHLSTGERFTLRMEREIGAIRHLGERIRARVGFAR